MIQDNFNYNTITGLQYKTVVPTEIEVVTDPIDARFMASNFVIDNAIFDPYSTNDNNEHFTME